MSHGDRSRTFLSASFSSFISFSFALTRAIDTLSFARFSYGVNPEPGRKAFLGSCHCFPVVFAVSENSLKPPGYGADAEGTAYHSSSCPRASPGADHSRLLTLTLCL